MTERRHIPTRGWVLGVTSRLNRLLRGEAAVAATGGAVGPGGGGGGAGRINPAPRAAVPSGVFGGSGGRLGVVSGRNADGTLELTLAVYEEVEPDAGTTGAFGGFRAVLDGGATGSPVTVKGRCVGNVAGAATDTGGFGVAAAFAGQVAEGTVGHLYGYGTDGAGDGVYVFVPLGPPPAMRFVAEIGAATEVGGSGSGTWRYAFTGKAATTAGATAALTFGSTAGLPALDLPSGDGSATAGRFAVNLKEPRSTAHLPAPASGCAYRALAIPSGRLVEMVAHAPLDAGGDLVFVFGELNDVVVEESAP